MPIGESGGSSRRPAERRDLARIAKLVRCSTLELFSDAATNPRLLFEKACLSIVQEDGSGRIISAIFYCNYPPVPALPQSDWPSWMSRLYNAGNFTAENTLFVHLLVWDDCCEENFLDALFVTTLDSNAHLSYLVLLQPPGVIPADVIRREMTRIAPENVTDASEAQVLYVSDRDQMMPNMTYRLAIEEDNDDIVEILDAESSLLRKFYGDFYISEMMRHPDEMRRIFVAEKENSVAKVICLNRSVDLDLLNDKFDMAVLGELRKQKEGAKRVSFLDDFKEFYSHVGDESDRNNDDDDDDVERMEDTMTDNNESCEWQSDSQDSEEEVVARAESSAFALELLGYRRAGDELSSRGLVSLGLVKAGFECFPELDYCIALVPSEQPHFPFLEFFTQVPLKANKDFPMALYVAHRAASEGLLRVREARPDDNGAVIRLLAGVNRARDVLLQFDEALRDGDANNKCPYVLTCDETVVALAIICAEKEVDRLRLCYRVEDLAPRMQSLGEEQDSHGRILGLALMPIFSTRLGFFLAEIMRLSHFRLLYHRARRAQNTDAPFCLGAMSPVEPRFRNWPQYQRYFKKSHCDAPFPDMFSLYLATPRSLMLKKKIINAKIVVVGASTCGLTFVETLASGFKYRDLRFTNITVVSVNGLPFEHSGEYATRIMIPFRGRYCYAYHDLTPDRTNYNVVKGTMINIDRDRRRVYIEDSGSLTYDYLILTCGLLFSRPDLRTDIEDDGEEFVDIVAPSNCYMINDDFEAESCLRDIREMTIDFSRRKSIVFHGCNVECYAALAAFLDLGVDGSWITLIESKYLEQDSSFQLSDQMRKAVHASLEASGVTLLSEHELVDWQLDNDDVGDLDDDQDDGDGDSGSGNGSSKNSPGRIRSLIVATSPVAKSDHDDASDSEISLECDALISFQAKAPCRKTFHGARLDPHQQSCSNWLQMFMPFWLLLSLIEAQEPELPVDYNQFASKAIMTAGLIFDGRLIIDAGFRTNDRRIFAAGTMTKYTKKMYQTTNQSHEFYNRREIGEKLAEKFIDALLAEGDFNSREKFDDIPTATEEMDYSFQMPIAISCLLPGGARYLHVQKPKPPPSASAYEVLEQNDVFTTGSCTADTGYFQLRLNQFRTVESVICYSRRDFDIQNMISLCGKHESLLNGLKERFMNSEVADLYAYFSEPWCTALFSDYFDEFQGKCDLTCSHEIIEQMNCRENLKEYLVTTHVRHDFEKISDKDRDAILNDCLENFCYSQKIEDCLTQFLEIRDDELPMYMTPQREREILREIEDTPLVYPDYVSEDDDSDKCSCE